MIASWLFQKHLASVFSFFFLNSSHLCCLFPGRVCFPTVRLSVRAGGWIKCEELARMAWLDSWARGLCRSSRKGCVLWCRALTGTTAVFSEIHHPWLLPVKYQGSYRQLSHEQLNCSSRSHGDLGTIIILVIPV